MRRVNLHRSIMRPFTYATFLRLCAMPGWKLRNIKPLISR